MGFRGGFRYVGPFHNEVLSINHVNEQDDNSEIMIMLMITRKPSTCSVFVHRCWTHFPLLLKEVRDARQHIHVAAAQHQWEGGRAPIGQVVFHHLRHACVWAKNGEGCPKKNTATTALLLLQQSTSAHGRRSF